jgi:hypothetical protein
VKNIVNVAAALDANNLLKVDVADIAGSAVATGSAQIGVNVVNIAGSAAALDGNNLLKVDCVDWAGGAIPAPNVTGTPKVDVVDISGSAVSTSTAQLGVNAVSVAAGAVTSIQAGLPTDSSIQTDCYNAMNTAYTDGTSLNSYGLLDRIRWLCWLIRNQMTITDATGAGVLYNDSGTSVASSWSVTDNATTTTRTRVA